MHASEFPGSSFCLIYLRLGDEEKSNLETQVCVAGKKTTLTKACSL